MTRSELLMKINSSKQLPVWDMLNIQKLMENMNGKASYADMDPHFLEDIRFITGTVNGIIMTDKDIGFILDVCRHCTSRSPLMTINLYYDRETGKFKGFGNPLYSRDTTEEKKPYDEASQEEIVGSIKQIITPLNTFKNQLILRDYIQADSVIIINKNTGGGAA